VPSSSRERRSASGEELIRAARCRGPARVGARPGAIPRLQRHRPDQNCPLAEAAEV